MKAVASRVTEKSDVLLLTAVDMEDSGPYEIAEPRVITALETYTPSCKLSHFTFCETATNAIYRVTNSTTEAAGGNRFRSSNRSARENRLRAYERQWCR
jgi:myosin-5